MKIYSKLALFLAVICLLALNAAPALAQSLQERLQAPAQLQAEYASASGKTKVFIDATVTVPEAARIPIYQVQPRQYTLEELEAMARAAFGDKPYEGQSAFEVEQREVGKFSSYAHTNYTLIKHSRERIQTGRTDRPLPAFDFRCFMSVLPDGRILDANAHFDPTQVVGEGFIFANNMPLPLSRQPQGVSLGITGARQLADAAVAAFAPGRALSGVGILTDEVMVQGVLESGKSSGNEAFVLYYTPSYELPETFAYQRVSEGDYQSITQAECITVVVDDRGIRSLWFDFPHEVIGKLAEDSQLLPFPQLMDIAGRLLPLKQSFWEKTFREYRVRVTDIRLGYMRVQSKNQPGQYQLVPAWDFFGTTEGQGHEKTGETNLHDHAYNSLLTLNAIDGTAIDRDWGY